MNEASSSLALCPEFSRSRQTPPPIPPPVVFLAAPPLSPPIMATAVSKSDATRSAVPPHLNGQVLEPMDPYRPPREILPVSYHAARMPQMAFAASMLLILGLGLWTRWLIDDSTARLEQASLALQSPTAIYQPTSLEEQPLAEITNVALAVPSVDPNIDDANANVEFIEPAVDASVVAEFVEVAPTEQVVQVAAVELEATHDVAATTDAATETAIQIATANAPAAVDLSAVPAENGAAMELPDCADGVCMPQRKLDTALVWAESIYEAAALANEQGKLVFLIHVSGNFEIQEFT